MLHAAQLLAPTTSPKPSPEPATAPANPSTVTTTTTTTNKKRRANAAARQLFTLEHPDISWGYLDELQGGSDNKHNNNNNGAMMEQSQRGGTAAAAARARGNSVGYMSTHSAASASNPSLVSLTALPNSSTPRSGSSQAITSSSGFLATTASNPFELRHGRRYLWDAPYPLPCDLSETHRQNMRTMLATAVFGGASCAPGVLASPPKRVLEIGCGAAYWSSVCHDWLTEKGHTDVAFTGLDIAPLAPDLAKTGMNWRFVQHDLRRLPWPFESGEFDLIMVKDMSMAVQTDGPTQDYMDETIRILAEGGILEHWESDEILRCLRPHPPAPPGTLHPEEATAQATKTYLISPGTPFAPAQNKYATNWNAWITAALDELKMSPTPCARTLNLLHQEADTLTDVGVRRIAVPLGELRWEREHAESKGKGRAMEGSAGPSSSSSSSTMLTPDQAALRYTALLTVLQKIESLEPLLKRVCGKNSEEWSRWWASMVASFMDPQQQESGHYGGEVLEMGAWWATKRTTETTTKQRA